MYRHDSLIKFRKIRVPDNGPTNEFPFLIPTELKLVEFEKSFHGAISQTVDEQVSSILKQNAGDTVGLV